MANHLQISRRNQLQVSRRPARNVDGAHNVDAAHNVFDEDDYESETYHKGSMIRVLQQHNAQLQQHIAHLQRQNEMLVQRMFDDRHEEREFLAAYLPQHAGGQGNQQAGGQANQQGGGQANQQGGGQANQQGGAHRLRHNIIMANRFQISRRPAHNLDEDDYENNQDNMPESEAVLAERERGAATIRILEQHNAELREHIAFLQRQFDQLLAAQLRQPAGGQVNQQAGRGGVASGLRNVADALN
ncbi:hypothetical protein B7494_g6416 [Chlorociboria aeruginascens]|nr:hypothetical protein B7494_g6416 [Chlorociboria aeruginascens]